MTSLNSKPASSTARQHQTLVIAGRRRGMELDEIRSMVGGSIRKLSAAQCSDWIKHLTGRDLPNPPGQKPSVYRGKNTSGAVRMITGDQVEQIDRLLQEYFRADSAHAFAWLKKNFKLEALSAKDPGYAIIRQLGTAKRAGQVIVVLKQMLACKTDRDHSPSRDRKGAGVPRHDRLSRHDRKGVRT